MHVAGRVSREFTHINWSELNYDFVPARTSFNIIDPNYAKFLVDQHPGENNVEWMRTNWMSL